jgi:hypothetical protein
MFIRLVVTQKDRASSKKQGIFVPAYTLLKGGELVPEEHDRLKHAVEWFQDNLPLPDRSKISPKGIFWFKAGAGESVQRIWDIVDIIKCYDYKVELIKTHKPGYIKYEDQFQICAIPFKDTAS